MIRIETALAVASLSRVKRRDPNNIYHRLSGSWLKSQVSAFSWEDYFDVIGKPKANIELIGDTIGTTIAIGHATGQ